MGKPLPRIKGQLERRVVDLSGIEIRAAGEDGVIAIRGHAAVFNRYSQPLYSFFEGRFVEQIAPGAFAKTLAEHDIRLLINHDPNLILARTASGTLRLSEDNIGLAVDADMAPTSYARDLALSIERGDVSQMSFRFEALQEDWSETSEGTPLRTVLEAKLYDNSIVTFPAYTDTDVALRSVQFEVLMQTLGLDTLDAAAREQFLNELLKDGVTAESEPALRAAEEALVRLRRSVALDAAPVMSHAVPLGVRSKRHQLKAQRLGIGR